MIDRYSNNDILYIIRRNFESNINLHILDIARSSSNINKGIFISAEKTFLTNVTYVTITNIGNKKEYKGAIDVEVIFEEKVYNQVNRLNSRFVAIISIDFVFYGGQYYNNYVKNLYYSNFNVLSSRVVSINKF